PCAAAGAAKAPRPTTASRMEASVRMSPLLAFLRLESRPELEVELPARHGLVEAVRVVEAQRAERRDQPHAHASTAQQLGRVDLTRLAPHATRVVEEGERQVVVEPDRVFGAEPQVRIAETVLELHARRATRTVAERSDGRFVVAAQRPAELDSTHPEPLEREPARVAEEHAGLGRESQRESDRP